MKQFSTLKKAAQYRDSQNPDLKIFKKTTINKPIFLVCKYSDWFASYKKTTLKI